MAGSIVADHLESLLLEFDYASRDIANHTAVADAASDEIRERLLQALEMARHILEGALDSADENGVPRLAIDAA